jgi:NADP-dependent 3-hydroxy acid dehydrogenase YdfG
MVNKMSETKSVVVTGTASGLGFTTARFMKVPYYSRVHDNNTAVKL